MVSRSTEKIIKQKANPPPSIKNIVSFSFWGMLSKARQAQVHVSRAIPKAQHLLVQITFFFALYNETGNMLLKVKIII